MRRPNPGAAGRDGAPAQAPRPARQVIWLAALAALLASASATRAMAASPLVALEIAPGAFSARALIAKQLSAVALYADGSRADLTTALKWSSSDSNVATVGNGARAGRVETLGVGSAQITAADATGHSASATVVVTAELVALEITPPAPHLRGGTGRALGARGTFSDGAHIPLRKVVTWSSGDEQIATVSNAAGKVGLVVAGNTLGTTTITATAGGPAPISATAAVTVDALLTGFEIAPRSLSLRVKKSKSIVALGSFTDGASAVEITRFLEFQTSDATVAVAKNRARKNGEGIGTVTGVGLGTAQITARSPSTGVAGANAVAVHVR